MGTKHKHYDVIVAWASGEEIQFLWDGEWEDYTESCPSFLAAQGWRVKPKRVKKEGWVNVYGYKYGFNVWRSKKEADESSDKNSMKPVACVRIEWEEEEE